MGLVQVDAQITGNFTEGNGTTEWTLGGYNTLPTISVGSLIITTPVITTATSAYYNTKQDISSSFSASFTWELTAGGSAADGFLFSIQNSSLTPTLTGNQTGSNKGYTSGVSIGLENYSGATTGLQLVGDGVRPTVTLGSMDCTTVGKRIDFNIAYDAIAQSFSVDLTQQGATGVSHTFTLTNSLASLIGGSTSYVGFTGGTGGWTETQTISNFNLGPVPEPGTWALLVLTGTFFIVTRRRGRG